MYKKRTPTTHKKECNYHQFKGHGPSVKVLVYYQAQLSPSLAFPVPEAENLSLTLDGKRKLERDKE